MEIVGTILLMLPMALVVGAVLLLRYGGKGNAS